MPGLRHQFYPLWCSAQLRWRPLALWEVHTDLPYPIQPAKPFRIVRSFVMILIRGPPLLYSGDPRLTSATDGLLC